MIYAINMRTKEHKVMPPGSLVGPSSDHKFVETDGAGWIPWEGESEDGPLAEASLCELKLSCGTKVRHQAAGEWSWSRGGDQHIIAYRPILDANPDPPAWAPDVGMECEIGASTQYLTIRYPEGSVVKLYTRFTDDRGVELFAFVGKNSQVSGVATAKCFAPLGTAARREEDRVAEAMRSVILDAGNAVYSEINGSTADSIARTLYRAIKSGKLKLESQP